jgi:AcrR family transcriptional regulator
VFEAEGYAAARIQAVCRAAGVSVGTFYDHFDNKADLMLRVVEQTSVDLPLPQAATLGQLESYVAAMVATPTAGVGRAWQEAIRIEPVLRSANEGFRRNYLARYTQWVADARAKRRVDAAIDDAATARGVLALLKEAVVGYEPAKASGDRVAQLVRAIWFLLYAE